jgi:dolichol-phosphate mannosyltransferase
MPNALLSIVLPVHNEREVIPETYARLTAVRPQLAEWGMECEFVFVNDGSTDDTPEMLDRIAATDQRVRVVHLARNFGHQAAVSAGLTVARGAAVVLMDADLQDPPEILPEFLGKWREGFQVVFAVRRKRKENAVKRLAYWTFYRLLNAISEISIPLDSGDFCLLDRSAVDLLNSLPERQRFVRGLRTWIGLKQVGVEYERDARFAGQPAYTAGKLVRLAVDGLVSFSNVPLKLVTRLGMLGLVASGLLGIWVLYAFLFDQETLRGWTSTAALILFTSAVQMISLGIIGEYLSRIFVEVKGRPTFLIARITNEESAVAEMTAASASDGNGNGNGESAAAAGMSRVDGDVRQHEESVI